MTVERERLDADVLIVGAGPAGLACALHLSRLIAQHNASGGKPELSSENIYVLEKGREIGAHQLSGAVMDPRGLAELVPDWEKTAPLESPVVDDAAFILTASSAWKLPITPPPLRNHGNYIVSINKLVKWLGGLVEQAGVNLFTQFAGAKLVYQGAGIAGVITDDKGVDKNGKPKDNYTPGYELRAKVTVLAEGPRGSLTKEMVNRLKLDGLNPQVYGIGIKELWEVPPGRIKTGYVAHTLGWPLDSSMYGGGWLYGLPENRVSTGMVIGLDYHNPRFDPHEAFQKFKTHPFLKRVLNGGKMVRYGAKTVPYGGWYSMPRTYVDGGLIIGDSASLLNSQRLKGIHTSIKSGMLAAETVFEALKTGDASSKTLAAFPQKIEQSWIKKELWAVRNFHQGFQHGLYAGLFHAGIQFVTGGRGLIDPMRTRPGFEEYRKLDGAGPAPERFKGDGKLTFDRLTDVYHSGTRHEEDQPCHLLVADLNICATKCVTEYGNPCQYFCPAAVYEMVQEKANPVAAIETGEGALPAEVNATGQAGLPAEASAKAGGLRLKINASNCVHCKTCDIADPYEIITWVPPEGGGGPNYEGM